MYSDLHLNSNESLVLFVSTDTNKSYMCKNRYDQYGNNTLPSLNLNTSPEVRDIIHVSDGLEMSEGEVPEVSDLRDPKIKGILFRVVPFELKLIHIVFFPLGKNC